MNALCDQERYSFFEYCKVMKSFAIIFKEDKSLLSLQQMKK